MKYWSYFPSQIQRNIVLCYATTHPPQGLRFLGHQKVIKISWKNNVLRMVKYVILHIKIDFFQGFCEVLTPLWELGKLDQLLKANMSCKLWFLIYFNLFFWNVQQKVIVFNLVNLFWSNVIWNNWNGKRINNGACSSVCWFL